MSCVSVREYLIVTVFMPLFILMSVPNLCQVPSPVKSSVHCHAKSMSGYFYVYYVTCVVPSCTSRCILKDQLLLFLLLVWLSDPTLIVSTCAPSPHVQIVCVCVPWCCFVMLSFMPMSKHSNIFCSLFSRLSQVVSADTQKIFFVIFDTKSSIAFVELEQG